MNSKLGTILSLLFMLLGITIWSISVLTVAPVAMSAISAIANDTPGLVTRSDEETVRDAAQSMQALSRLEADGRPAIAASKQQSIL